MPSPNGCAARRRAWSPSRSWPPAADRLTVAEDDEIIRTTALLLGHGAVAEASPVAAVLRVEHTRDVVVVLTGGNLSRARFDELLVPAFRTQDTLVTPAAA
ncbi:hypothetical protein ACIP5L_10235 [Streptomyces bacillaris]|uniref:hypothetical protein n=1 Tax=Streptomyces bacillaris TaxID=68179 RepID=UPI00380E8F0C